MMRALCFGLTVAVCAGVAILWSSISWSAMARGAARGGVMSVTAPRSQSDGAGVSLGTAVPASDADFVIAARVALDGDNMPSGDCFVFVSPKTDNHLRDEADGTVECDREGLVLSITPGPGAQAWGIPSGSPATITQFRNGVPVPASFVVGDEWFLTGVEVVTPPCLPHGE